jgi:hypothetical protein
MRSEKIKYLLFVYAKHDNQDEFVKMIAEEVSLLTLSDDVRFYYGEESMIYTFQTDEPFDELSEFMGIVLGGCKIDYLLLPYVDDKLSVNMSDEARNHLFGDKPITKIDNNVELDQKLIDEDNNNREFLFELYNDMMGDDDDDEVLHKIYKENNKKKKKPTVDEILDKIRLGSISSITKEEKEILDNYSKQL